MQIATETTYPVSKHPKLDELACEYARTRDARLISDVIGLSEGLVRAKERRLPQLGDQDERLRAGYDGIQKALSKFDPSFGVPFDKFAARSVVWAIKHYLDAQIAEQERRQEWIELDAPANGTDGSVNKSTHGDITGVDDPGFESADLRLAIEPALRQLPVQDRLLIRLRYFEGLFQHEVAGVFAMSQGKVSEWECKVLRDLKTKLAELGEGLFLGGANVAGAVGEERQKRASKLIARASELLPRGEDFVSLQGFAEGVARLRSVARRDVSNMEPSFLDADGYPLGAWVWLQQRLNNERLLSDNRRQAIRMAAPRLALGRPVRDARTGYVKFLRGLENLRIFVGEHHHSSVPQTHLSAGGFQLGKWVTNLRMRARSGIVANEQLMAVRAVAPDFDWNPADRPFGRGVEALGEFRATFGHSRVGQDYRNESGFLLGAWVDRIRRTFVQVETGAWTEGFDQARYEAVMSAAPDFEWRPKAAAFARGLQELGKYYDENGDSRVPQAFVTRDGYRLGRWVANTRYESCAHERKQRILEIAPDFHWSSRVEGAIQGVA